MTDVGLCTATMVNERKKYFHELSGPFEYIFLSLRGTLQCTIKPLIAPRHLAVQSDVDLGVYDMDLYASFSPSACAKL